MQNNQNLPDAPPSYEYATSTQPSYQSQQPSNPSYPGQQPTHPGQPTTQPPYPTQQTTLPSYPGQPTTQPTYPGQPTTLPSYPGQPTSQPSYPGQPSTLPSYPGEPAYPSSYQAYSGLPGPLGRSGHPSMGKTTSPPVNHQFVATPALREDPVHLTCPHCHTSVTTRTSTTTQDSALGWAVCLFCFCWPLMWLTCVICRKTTHSCPNCNYEVGKYKSG